jgi:hypothetical protein
MKLVAHLGFVIDFWSLGNKTATSYCLMFTGCFGCAIGRA